MAYVTEILPLARALEAAGYADVLDSERERYLLVMEKHVGDQSIVVAVGGDAAAGQTVEHYIPVRLRASYNDRSFDRTFQASGVVDGAGGFESLIAELEAHLLASG